MNDLERETSLKLDILASLARSQKAMARLIECISEIGGSSEQMSGKLLKNINIISSYQMMLTNKISGIRIRRQKSGKPARPWLNNNLI